jgi:hypothetical protein
MKIAIKISTMISLCFILFSCEDPIDVAIPEGKTMLVVDAFLNDQLTTQTIRLTTTSPYFSNVNVPSVSGALVSVTDITAGKNFTFNDVGNGNYSFTPVAADSFAIGGHQFLLNVNWTGLNYTATSELKRTTPIDTIVFIKQEGGQGFEKGYYPYIFAFDQPNGKDYYWLKAYKNNIYFSDPSNINVLEDAGGGDGTDGLAFIPPNAFFIVTPSDQPFQLINSNNTADICKIECYSLNQSTYEFLLQAQVQMTNSSSGLFATTPENVRTNITPVGNAPQALGWFNIGALSSKTLPVAE